MRRAIRSRARRARDRPAGSGRPCASLLRRTPRARGAFAPCGERPCPSVRFLVADARCLARVRLAARAGMWRYGEIDDDECLEFGVNRQKADAAKAAAAPATNAWGKK